MSEDTTVHAELRENFGKGFARRLRAAGKIPAVLYGHGTDPQHLEINAHDFAAVLRNSGTNAVLTLDIAGKEQLALTKQVVVHPIKRNIEHADLIVVKRGEKVTVEVPLHVIGADEKADRVIVMDQQTITLEVEATNIPAAIEIDVTALGIGDSIAAKDLNLPEGAVFPGEPDDLMLSVTAAKTQEQIDAELDAAVAGDEGEAPAEAEAEAEAAESE